MTKLRHFDNLGTARFVTFSTFRRHKLLMHPGIAELFLLYLNQIRRKYVLSLWGYVVMPDHIHLVLKPDNGLALGSIIGELKSISARTILAQLHENSAIDLGMISRGNGRVAHPLAVGSFL